MTDKEVALFEAVTNCASNYLEFGSGGSTVLATTTVSSTVISIDSSQQWLDSVRANATSAPSDRLILHYVDIGPTGEWGAPTDNNCKDKWPAYSLDVWSINGAEQSDVFFVDGRFRVCCFAESLARAKSGAVIMIHDFARTDYHVVNQIAPRIAQVDQLAVFIKDDRSNVSIAKKMAHQYRYVWG
jgi:hypothetical protein